MLYGQLFLVSHLDQDRRSPKLSSNLLFVRWLISSEKLKFKLGLGLTKLLHVSDEILSSESRFTVSLSPALVICNTLHGCLLFNFNIQNSFRLKLMRDTKRLR
jgi:hypothetical protein